jgi:hypothetical protein
MTSELILKSGQIVLSSEQNNQKFVVNIGNKKTNMNLNYINILNNKTGDLAELDLKIEIGNLNQVENNILIGYRLIKVDNSDIDFEYFIKHIQKSFNNINLNENQELENAFLLKKLISFENGILNKFTNSYFRFNLLNSGYNNLNFQEESLILLIISQNEKNETLFSINANGIFLK